MNSFEITIGEQQYEYIDSIHYHGKNYVAFATMDTITINEYILANDQVILKPISDALFLRLKEEMKLDV